MIGYLVITNLLPSEWRFAFTDAAKIIGRGTVAQIRVPRRNPSVSRRHARIWADRHLWICDLSSTLGTRVNGVLIPPEWPTKVTPGDRVMLGDLELIVVGEPKPSDHVLDDDVSPSSDSGLDTRLRKSTCDTVAQSEAFSLDVLTNAEREVVLWMSRGHTHLEELGKKLFRSPHTVRTQLSKIFQKLGVHSRDELMGLLMRLDLGNSSDEV
jgi:DNA-binding CsgD family transcriptional regulator